jgi:hypothetical protein
VTTKRASKKPTPARAGDTREQSPTMHDPRTQAAFDYSSRQALEELLQQRPGLLPPEKLENFAKYVPRQNLAPLLPATRSSS